MEEINVVVRPKIIFLIILSIFVLFFLFSIKNVLILVFLAYLLMIALTPINTFIIYFFKLRRNKLLATFLTYILTTSFLFFLIVLIFPTLIKEMLGLINIIAKIFRQLNLPILTNFDYRNVTLSYDQITNFFSQFNNIFSKLGFTLNIFFQVFGISIMSFYMMNDKNNFYKKFYWFTKSEKKIKKIKHFFIVLENQLGGWVRGQFILMVIIGVITYVALFFFQLPYALPLAILAGLLEALPGLGPTLSSVPAIIFALFLNNNGEINIVYGISIAVLYFVIQQIENTFLVPKIMSDNAHINPLISIMSILIGFEIAGVFGALLALPFFIICRCIYQIYNNLA